jgi:hypothetical protein
MFFLLRAAFWLSIVLLLLPSDPAKRIDPARPQFGAAEALGFAQAAFEDARGFCARRPEACETGSHALHGLGEKAQYGAKLMYEFLSDKLADEPSVKRENKTGNARLERPGRHNLTPEDMAAPWNGVDPRPAQVPLPPRRPV